MYRTFYEDFPPRFASISTLFNLPFRGRTEEVDFVVAGLPFDSGAVNRPEARYAPVMIRTFPGFKGGMGYHELLDIDADEVLKGTDVGEVNIDFGYKIPSLRKIAEAVKPVAEQKKVFIGLGGGQLVTLAELRAMKEVYGPVALLHLSAGRSVCAKEELYDDTTVVIRAVEEGLVDPASSVQAGIRGGYDSKEECEYGKELGMKILTAEKMYGRKPEELAGEIKAQIGEKPCFLSLNMNFLDPVYAPGVAEPVAAGFSTFLLGRLLADFGLGLQVVGFDLVGLVAAFDQGYVTAQASSNMVKQFLQGMAKRKEENGGVLL